MNISSVTTDSKFLRTELSTIATDTVKRTWRIQVSRTGEAPVGNFQATLEIKTSHPQRPLVTIPITGEVQGDIQRLPSQAFFGFIKKGILKTVTIVIQSRSSTPFQLYQPQLTGNAAGTVKVEGNFNLKQIKHTLFLHLDASRPQYVTGNLQIHTDVTGEEILVIPITALIDNMP